MTIPHNTGDDTKYFNSHAHVERDLKISAYFGVSLDFNSHAHVERDLKVVRVQDYLGEISTHTLTWSVTY